MLSFFPVDVTRGANGFRSRSTYFSSFMSPRIPIFTKGMCYTENHTNKYFKAHSNYGSVGSSTVSSRAMRRRV
jgi:hypothetical protein